MPDEWFGVLVPVVSPLVDGVDELVDAGEAGPAELFIGEFFEPGSTRSSHEDKVI